MIDELNTIIQIKPPLEVIQQTKKTFIANGIKFIPKWNPINDFITYNGMLGNLRLSINYDKLSIKNSWHKFYKGNNYSDYSFTDLQKTYEKLESELDISIIDADIKRIAYGCVIKTNSKNEYSKWKFLRTKEPYPIHNKGIQYGNSFNFNEYKVKGYDKTYEVWKHDGIRIESDLFRFEKEINYLKYLRRTIPIYKVKDVLNKEILIRLSNDLLKTYKMIEKDQQYNLKGLTTKELYSLAIMKDNAIRNEFKENHNKTYKRYMRLYKNILEGKLNANADEIESLISDKLNTLLNS